MSAPVFHLAVRSEWEAAREAGEAYRRSTLGASLEEVGFVHLSHRHQVAGVANAFYAECSEPLCLLVIDPAALSGRVVEEEVGDDTFPHAYGPIDLAAVVDVLDYERAADGRFPDPPAYPRTAG